MVVFDFYSLLECFRENGEWLKEKKDLFKIVTICHHEFRCKFLVLFAKIFTNKWKIFTDLNCILKYYGTMRV
jgi:hypothetical protein